MRAILKTTNLRIKLFFIEDVYDEEEEKFDGNIFVWKGETNDIQKNIARKLSLLKLEKYFFKSSSISTRDKGVALADGDSSSQFPEVSLFGQLIVDSKDKIGTTEQQKIFLVNIVILEIFLYILQSYVKCYDIFIIFRTRMSPFAWSL
jgi:hypothetical protein